MSGTNDYDEANAGLQTGVRVNSSSSSQAIHCDGCKKDFADEDDYLDHIYDNDKCYNEYLASDRKEMGKE